MAKKLFTLLLAVAASMGTLFAQKVQIGDLYYNLDATNQTAQVTSQNSSYPYWSATIATANIPSSVEYNSLTYSVTSIGDYAFQSCSGLTSVTIGNSVTSIGDGAFANCKGLTSITIGNSVTSIGNDAFYKCGGLTSVNIPNSVTSIGGSAFAECKGLASINVASDNSNYCSVDGVLFNKDKTTLIQYPGGKQGAYIIPNSVTSIGNYAFAECTGLTSVTIGNSVTSIEDGAFYYCSGLTSIIVENGNSFYDSRNNCNAIIETATNTLIVGCMNTIIPNSVTSIGDRAFLGCTGLTSVTIPNSVTSIGGVAFAECTGLTSITCDATTPPTLGSYVFYIVNKSIPLYIPAESIEAYQAADQWKDFTNIIGLDDGDVEESNIRYIDPSNNELGSETVSLHLPDVPEIEGFTFLKWQVIAGDLEEGIIIQAVYQADESTSASSVYTNPANPAQKLIRNGNVYILSNEKTYSITGQEVIVP